MTPELLAEVMEATWPPARRWSLGPIDLRDGAGGGKRVSAASVRGAWTQDDITAAETAMAEPLFVIREGDVALDEALAARGYQVIDPVVAYAAPVGRVVGEVPVMVAFPHWPPLAIACQIWDEGGIGPARVAVMARAEGEKCVILARINDRPAGVAFVALHGDQAMLHALDVTPSQRRQGVARHILRAAANWAQDRGAAQISLVVTTRNSAARALYASVGMDLVGKYHYRLK